MKGIGASERFFKKIKSLDEARGKEVSALVRSNYLKALDISLPADKECTDNKTRCFLWIRNGDYEECRNLNEYGFDQICGLLKLLKVEPILIGNKAEFAHPDGANLIEFWHRPELPELSGDPGAQLKHLIEQVREKNIQFSIGMKSGGMDGLCFATGLPTLFIGKNKKLESRMVTLANVFPFIHVEGRFEGEGKEKRFDGFSCVQLEELKTQIRFILNRRASEKKSDAF